MNQIKKLLVIGLGMTALYGCGSDNNGNTHNQTSLRVIHAGADAPKVNVVANGAQLISGLDYATSSGFATVNATTYDIDVNAILPDATTPTVLDENYTLVAERQYSVVAIGSVADSTLEALVIENAVSAIESGYIRVQALHGSPAVPAVDIYVTAPDGKLTSPTATLSYRQFTDQISVPAGDYRVRIAPEGTQTVVYDSGTLPLAAGSDLLLTAAPNVYGGNPDAPVVLLAANGSGASVIFGQNTGADVRAVHAVADAPAVDVTLNNAATPAITGLEYAQETAFVQLPKGTQTVTVSAPSVPLTVIDNAPVDLEVGKFYDAIAVGSVINGDFGIELLPVVEDRRKVATEAKVTLVHGSVTAGTVDVYITPTDDISSASPAISAFKYKDSATGVALMPGEAVISITPTGTKDVAIGPLTVNFEGGKLYGAVAQDNVGGGTPLGVNGFDELD